MMPSPSTAALTDRMLALDLEARHVDDADLFEKRFRFDLR
jgi:hypothetical protein